MADTRLRAVIDVYTGQPCTLYLFHVLLNVLQHVCVCVFWGMEKHITCVCVCVSVCVCVCM